MKSLLEYRSERLLNGQNPTVYIVDAIYKVVTTFFLYVCV